MINIYLTKGDSEFLSLTMLALELSYVLYASFILLTSTYAADVVDYFIMPVEKISLQDSHLLQLTIEELAGGSQKVYASRRRGEPSPAYWMAPLPLSGYHKLLRNRLVGNSLAPVLIPI